MENYAAEEELDVLVDRILRDQNAFFHMHVVEFMNAHLADCAEVFGDLHEMQVFTIVVQKYLRDRLSDANRKDGAKGERRAVTASRIAAQTGMPRETVRRKLAALEARGWIEKTENSAWRMSLANGRLSVGLTLEEFTRREMRRVIKLGRAIKPLI